MRSQEQDQGGEDPENLAQGVRQFALSKSHSMPKGRIIHCFEPNRKMPTDSEATPFPRFCLRYCAAKSVKP
ncbi:hypothetical protein FRZ44_33660 [Hypericibacter terrae]|uniref:Uncharacterized protein n=1 Tax=Hypericibacter terrae TaxID=2602015 RepID=A0A5J6MKE6_9PROT|nr:hypothetical protein FRZ44_33660 [Hypericibacter terrae]